jgi:Las1-like
MNVNAVPRLLPWKDWNEWTLVRSQLWATQPNARAEGVSRVAVWRSRERIPHAVDCTAQLVDIALHDAGWHSLASERRSDMELRLLYSSIVLRCVNGLVDAGQKGSHAMSVQHLAKAVGLPSWLVDLRHDAAHKELPSLSTLRLAGNFLLDYLLQRYWAVQQEHLDFMYSAYTQLLSRYAHAAEQERTLATELQEAMHQLTPHSEDDSAASSLINKNVHGNGAHNLAALASDLIKSVTPTGAASIVIPLLVHGAHSGPDTTCGAGFLIPYAFSTYPKGEAAAKVLFARWTPLLSALQLQWNGFTAALAVQICEKLLQLCRATAPRDDYKAATYFATIWLQHLIQSEAYVPAAVSTASSATQLLHHIVFMHANHAFPIFFRTTLAHSAFAIAPIIYCTGAAARTGHL